MTIDATIDATLCALWRGVMQESEGGGAMSIDTHGHLQATQSAD